MYSLVTSFGVFEHHLNTIVWFSWQMCHMGLGTICETEDSTAYHCYNITRETQHIKYRILHMFKRDVHIKHYAYMYMAEFYVTNTHPYPVQVSLKDMGKIFLWLTTTTCRIFTRKHLIVENEALYCLAIILIAYSKCFVNVYFIEICLIAMNRLINVYTVRLDIFQLRVNVNFGCSLPICKLIKCVKQVKTKIHEQTRY